MLNLSQIVYSLKLGSLVLCLFLTGSIVLQAQESDTTMDNEAVRVSKEVDAWRAARLDSTAYAPVDSSESKKVYKEIEEKFQIYFLDENHHERKDKEKFMAELVRLYPKGTEQLLEDGKRKIVRRIVINEGKGYEYLKVSHEWGGVYYFKNGSSISEFTWHKETQSIAKSKD